MRVAVLFSGGKDSSLSAFLMSPHFEVTLVTATFGIEENWRVAKEVARILGYPYEVLKMDEEILEEAVEMMIRDGNTRKGFTEIHKKVIEEVSKRFSVIVDGIRRDDISPKLTLDEIRSLESRLDIHYITPLMGFSRKTVNLMTRRYFEIEEGNNLYTSDYEFEVRSYMRDRGVDPSIVFPKNHVQSIVRARKDGYGQEDAWKKVEISESI